jgi:hypothetical protein
MLGATAGHFEDARMRLLTVEADTAPVL